MKVILKQRMPNLGEVGDVIKVADGYARNYLLPKGIAIPVTPRTLASVAKLKAQEEKRRAQELHEAEMLLKQIEKLTLNFERLADENDRMFGSVSEKDIIDALALQGYTLEKYRIKMEKPIKELGEHSIPIEFSDTLKGSVKVIAIKKASNDEESN